MRALPVLISVVVVVWIGFLIWGGIQLIDILRQAVA